MNYSRNSPISGAAAALAIVAAALIAGCASPASGPNGYTLVGVESSTNSQTGVRKEIKHWRHDDGTETTSSKTVFNPQGGRPPRGTKPH
jgi:hypothetical protein